MDEGNQGGDDVPMGGVQIGDVVGGIHGSVIASGNVNVHIQKQDEAAIRGLLEKAMTDFFPDQSFVKADFGKAEDLILVMQKALAETKEQSQPAEQSYYLLGMSYVSRGELEAGEAAFLAALNANPQMGKAHLGLAMIWQLYANELIRLEQFRPAEELLNKSEDYANKAREVQDDDPNIYVQLGYMYKELAQRYDGSGREEKAEASMKKGLFHFKLALGVDEKLASAHNGLASLYLVQGDYDRAIEASKKAVELEDSYLYAYFDLAMGYYGKALRAGTKQEFIAALVGFQEAVERVVELNGTEAGTLPESAERSLVRIANWMTHQKWGG